MNIRTSLNMMEEKQRKVNCIVAEKFENCRIDNFLSDKFDYHSRKRWQELIKNEIILLNGKPSKNSKKLKTGDFIEFIIDSFEEPECNLNYKIAYEDNYLIAINKPPNCIIHPVGPFFKNTLTYKMEEDFKAKVYSVNRLDRETTGLVLFGKNQNTAKLLSEAFIRKEIKKEYIAAVHGTLNEKIDAKGYLLKNTQSLVRKKRMFQYNYPKNTPETDFETAETLFEPVKTKNNLTLLKVNLKTGRQHQIRATLCSLGYPLVGDKLYGLDDTMYLRFIEKKLKKTDYKKLIISHQALHAEKLCFIHPDTKKELNIKAPVPEKINSLFE